MLTTPLKAFLLVAAGAAALATVAYVSGALDRFIEAPPRTIAALPDPAAPADPAAPKGDRMDQADAPATGAPAARAPAATEIVPPSFDLVRVEPDGSLVVAGNAAPGSQIELLTGSKVIGSAVAGPEGDFAVVLDEPLEPGGYQIVLRATDQGGVVAMSAETAVVSIPEQESGQVLALVEKPGEPSKLITVPEPEDPAASAEPEASVAEAAPRASDSGTPAAEAETSAAAEPQAPAGENAADVAASAPDPDAEGQAEDQAEVAAAPAQPAAPAGQPAAPAQPDAAAGAQPEAPVGAQTEQQVASAPEPQETAPQGDTAVEPQNPAAPSASTAPSADPKVKVEAVEIEGNQVFVAGIAEPGALVRVYANDIFLGETRASPGGQFLVEALRELAVGDYIIRADVVADDGSTVIVRATVPFQREPGEAIAAVAPTAPEPSAPAPSDEPAQAAVPAAEPAQPAAPAETPPSTVAEAPAAAEAPVVAEGQPDAAASGEPDGAAMQGEATANAEERPATPDASGQGTAVASAEAPAATPDKPSQGLAAASAETSSATKGAATQGATAQDQAMSSAETPAEPSQQTAAAPSSKPAASAGPPSIAGQSLQPVDGSVIIRRGDSLWRISRRVYGRGIRYSTIYLANQDQIADPDLIWPGQVFRVPEKTRQGETADMEAISDRQPPKTAKGDSTTATR